MIMNDMAILFLIFIVVSVSIKINAVMYNSFKEVIKEKSAPLLVIFVVCQFIILGVTGISLKFAWILAMSLSWAG